MTALKAESTAEEAVAVVSVVEGEIRDLFRKDMAARRPRSEAGSELDPEGLTSVIGRISGHSVQEIDSLISELQQVRSFLRAEGERLQRDLTRYAEMNQSALASVKIINEAIGPWKSSATEKRPVPAIR